MSVREIVTYPDPVLKRQAAPIEAVDDEVRRLMDDMTETVLAAPGLGLAAPQVGESVRVIVISPRPEEDDDAPPEVMCLANPEIVEAEGEIAINESCLSLTDFNADIDRAARVVIEALNRDGKHVRVEADDLMAVVFQHEIDHLDGVLLVDYISSLKRNLYKSRLKKMAKNEAG